LLRYSLQFERGQRARFRYATEPFHGSHPDETREHQVITEAGGPRGYDAGKKDQFAHIDPFLGTYGVHRAVVNFAVTRGWRFAWFAYEPNASTRLVSDDRKFQNKTLPKQGGAEL
jgi:hypothetical protein